jgi:hypothetical protein
MSLELANVVEGTEKYTRIKLGSISITRLATEVY